MHVILVRHGQTLWSESGQHTSFTDIDLTANGILQAQKLQPILQTLEFQKVFTSPRIRAKKTCEIALQSSKHPSIIVDDLLQEWDYGDYEGLTTPEIWKKQPSWNLFSQGCPNGENAEDVGKRADLFIEKLIQANQNSIIFSHGHFLRVLATRWIQLPPQCAKVFTLNVASISKLGYERDQRTVLQWNCY